MTYEKRTLISLHDIEAIEFHCPKCHGRQAVALLKFTQPPFRCANCSEPFLEQAAVNEPDQQLLADLVGGIQKIKERHLGKIV